MHKPKTCKQQQTRGSPCAYVNIASPFHACDSVCQPLRNSSSKDITYARTRNQYTARMCLGTRTVQHNERLHALYHICAMMASRKTATLRRQITVCLVLPCMAIRVPPCPRLPWYHQPTTAYPCPLYDEPKSLCMRRGAMRCSRCMASLRRQSVPCTRRGQPEAWQE